MLNSPLIELKIDNSVWRALFECHTKARMDSRDEYSPSFEEVQSEVFWPDREPNERRRECARNLLTTVMDPAAK